MLPRPTPALALPLLGCVVLNLLSRVSADPWLALASSALIALPFAALLLRPCIRLEAHLQAPRRVVAGQQVDVVVRISNPGRRSTAPALWRHEHPALSALEVAVPELAPGASIERLVSRQALSRGVHSSGVATTASSAPFGLFRWTAQHLVQGPPVIVHPVTSTALTRLDGGSALATQSSVPVPGAGFEVLDLRPWRPGDARREVSARASARHGRPVVLQRERDAGQTLVLLATGGGRGPGWESAVSAAASLTLQALWDGHPPVVLADPAPGRVDSIGLLDFFAGVDAAAPLTQQAISSAIQLAGRGGTIFLLAPPEARGPVLAAATGCRVEVIGG